MSSVSWSKEISGLQFKVFLFEEQKDKIHSRDLDNPTAAGENYHLYIDQEYIQKFDRDFQCGDNGAPLHPKYIPRIKIVDDLLVDKSNEFYEYFGKEFMAYHSNNLDLEDDLSRKYDPIVIKTLLKYFKEAEKDLYHVDNYRFANVGKEDEMKEYEKRKSGGCCGCYDELVEAYGITYKIGFNYGH